MKRKEYIYRLCNLLGSQGKFIRSKGRNIVHKRGKDVKKAFHCLW